MGADKVDIRTSKGGMVRGGKSGNEARKGDILMPKVTCRRQEDIGRVLLAHIQPSNI